MSRLVLALALALWPTVATAAVEADGGLGSVQDSIPEPGVVGEVLASQLMGVDELTPLRPGSLGDVAASLGAFTRNGALLPGVAAELTPWALGLGSATTHQRYVEDAALRVLGSSSLSLATAGDPGADGGVRGAVALRFQFVDGSDWRLNSAAIDCASRAYGPLPLPPPPPTDGGVPGGDTGIERGPEVGEAVLANVRKCLSDHVKWNATQLAAGLALTVRVPQGELARTTADELQFLVATGFGIGAHVQVLATLRYAFRFAQGGGGLDPAIVERHRAGLGGRLAVKLDRFVANLNLGAGAELTSGQLGFLGLVGLTLQYKLSDVLWLDSAVNATINGTGPPSALTFGSSLKWSYDFKQLK